MIFSNRKDIIRVVVFVKKQLKTFNKAKLGQKVPQSLSWIFRKLVRSRTRGLVFFTISVLLSLPLSLSCLHEKDNGNRVMLNEELFSCNPTLKVEGQSKMPSSSSAPGKQLAGNKASLRSNKHSKAIFKRAKMSKENVEPPLEPIGKLLQKSKVELCSLEKRLRCFRHKIGESKWDWCKTWDKKSLNQIFLRRRARGWSALARTVQVWIYNY